MNVDPTYCLNVKLQQLIITVIERTHTNEIEWHYDGNYKLSDYTGFHECQSYTTNLKNGFIIKIRNLSKDDSSSPKLQYIITSNENRSINNKVFPWEINNGYELWLNLFNAAKENVYVKSLE